MRDAAATISVVLGPTWLGDTLMAVPVLRALRRAFPESEWVLATRLPLGGLLDGVERAPLSRVLRLPVSFAGAVRALRALSPRRVVVLPNSWRGALLAAAAGARERWGYASEGRGALLAPPTPPPRRRGHQVHDYDELLAAHGVPPPSRDDFRLRDPARRVARGTLDGARIGLNPGGAFGPSKRWPAARFGRLAADLAARGAIPVLVGGPGDEAPLAAARQSAPTDIATLGERRDLAGLASELAGLDLLVTNDTGPMHLAAAVGTRVVALFGPTNPARTAPLGEGHHVLWRDIWCSPCFLKVCPYAHECLEGIPVSAVLSAVQTAIAR